VVHAGQHPPRRGIRSHRPEQLRLITHHCQVSDRLPTIGQHHRHVHGAPPRIVTTLPAPQPEKHLTEPLDQAGGLGDVGQQQRAGVTDHAPPVRSDTDLRPRPGNRHLASAFPDG
jgi:hypothetical protein